MLPQLTDLELIQEYGRETCRCGSPKERGHTFCRSCYFCLTNEQRKALFAKFGKGYREAYEDAIATIVVWGRLIDDGEGSNDQAAEADETEGPERGAD